MRTFATLSIAGVSTVVLLKLLATLMLPLLGALFGLFAMALKFSLIAGVAFFVYSLVCRRKDEQTA